MGKQCPKCGIVKAASAREFGLRPNGKFRGPCRECERKAVKVWAQKHPAAVRAAALRWQKRNPQKASARNRRWQARHPEQYLAIQLGYQAKQRRDLTDRYIRSLIINGTTIPHRAVPDSIISLKRVHLQLLRHLKQTMHYAKA